MSLFKLNRILLAVAMGALVSGCQTMQPASYANYADTTFMLRKMSGAKVRISSVSDKTKPDEGCRLIGRIQTAGDRPIAEFIKDSYNDEFKFAGVYADDPGSPALALVVNQIGYSSIDGFWNFDVGLSNPSTGKSMVVDFRYEFKNGFNTMDGNAACINTSQALTPAIQRLINKTVTDSRFNDLIVK